MTTAKYYTTEEGGHWTPFLFEISKEAFDGYEQKLLHRKITITNFTDSKTATHITCASIMFSDGTIYDCEQAKYRSEDTHPKEFVIDYMNTTLKDLYE